MTPPNWLAGLPPDRPAARPAVGEAHRLVTFPRTDTEELRVELASLDGHPFINLRIWFRTPAGQWLPTKKGVTVRLRELPELLRALGEVKP